MQKVFFWTGWGILFYISAVYGMQAWVEQDLPKVELWKWIVPFVAFVFIYLGRERDDVLKHHVV